MPNNPAATKMNPADNSSGSRSDLVDHGELLRDAVQRQDAAGGGEAPGEMARERDPPTEVWGEAVPKEKTQRSSYTTYKIVLIFLVTVFVIHVCRFFQ